MSLMSHQMTQNTESTVSQLHQVHGDHRGNVFKRIGRMFDCDDFEAWRNHQLDDQPILSLIQNWSRGQEEREKAMDHEVTLKVTIDAGNCHRWGCRFDEDNRGIQATIDPKPVRIEVLWKHHLSTKKTSDCCWVPNLTVWWGDGKESTVFVSRPRIFALRLLLPAILKSRMVVWHGYVIDEPYRISVTRLFFNIRQGIRTELKTTPGVSGACAGIPEHRVVKSWYFCCIDIMDNWVAAFARPWPALKLHLNSIHWIQFF